MLIVLTLFLVTVLTQGSLGSTGHQVTLDRADDLAPEWSTANCTYAEIYADFNRLQCRLSDSQRVIDEIREFPRKRGFWTPCNQSRCEVNYRLRPESGDATGQVTVHGFLSGHGGIEVRVVKARGIEEVIGHLSVVGHWAEDSFQIPNLTGNSMLKIVMTQPSYPEDLAILDRVEIRSGLSMRSQIFHSSLLQPKVRSSTDSTLDITTVSTKSSMATTILKLKTRIPYLITTMRMPVTTDLPISTKSIHTTQTKAFDSSSTIESSTSGPIVDGPSTSSTTGTTATGSSIELSDSSTESEIPITALNPVGQMWWKKKFEPITTVRSLTWKYDDHQNRIASPELPPQKSEKLNSTKTAIPHDPKSSAQDETDADTNAEFQLSKESDSQVETAETEKNAGIGHVSVRFSSAEETTMTSSIPIDEATSVTNAGEISSFQTPMSPASTEGTVLTETYVESDVDNKLEPKATPTPQTEKEAITMSSKDDIDATKPFESTNETNPGPQPKPEVETEQKSTRNPKSTPAQEPESESSSELKPTISSEPEPKSTNSDSKSTTPGPEPASNNDALSTAAPQPKPESTNYDSKPIPPEPEPESNNEAKSTAASEPEPESTNSDPKSTSPEPESNNETKSTAVSEPEPKSPISDSKSTPSEPALESSNETKSTTVSEPVPNSDSDSKSTPSEPEPESNNETKSTTVSEPEPNSQNSDSKSTPSEPALESSNETKSTAVSEPVPNSDSKSTPSVPEPESNNETKSTTASEPEPNSQNSDSKSTPSEPEPEPELNNETKSTTGPKLELELANPGSNSTPSQETEADSSNESTNSDAKSTPSQQPEAESQPKSTAAAEPEPEGTLAPPKAEPQPADTVNSSEVTAAPVPESEGTHPTYTVTAGTQPEAEPTSEEKSDSSKASTSSVASKPDSPVTESYSAASRTLAESSVPWGLYIGIPAGAVLFVSILGGGYYLKKKRGQGTVTP